LYVTSAGDGFVSGPTGNSWISAGVNWGVFDSTGTVVFFTVGDQLRRQGASGSPVPVVVQGFDQAVVWNADMSRVVYSNKVEYDVSEKRDLRVTSTDWFNPTPTSLVNTPIAELGRSVLTTSGDYVLYFTDVVQGQGGKLFVRPITGAAAVTFPNVDTVLAGDDNMILFTDNRTAPGIYPVLVDLKKVDAGGVLGAQLIESGIVEGRDIQVRSDRNTVAYRREGDVATSIWLRPITNQP
jgi:hypothetical protein